jgi:hypothetical protein
MCVLSSPEQERDFEFGSPSPYFGSLFWEKRLEDEGATCKTGLQSPVPFPHSDVAGIAMGIVLLKTSAIASSHRWE